MIKGSCHCGTVTFEILEKPAFVIACNCSICRKLNTQWAYSHRTELTLNAPIGSTHIYQWGDKDLEFHSCQTCGCTTHWMASNGSRYAVNCQLASEADMKEIRVRHLDGVDTWEFSD